MKNYIGLFAVVFLFWISWGTAIAQKQKTVGVTIDIPEGTINNFLNEQYTKAGFKRNIKGNIAGITYDITLQLPTVGLDTDNAQILFGFDIKSNVLNDHVSFSDALSFRIKSINNLTVEGISQNFVSKVNSLGIPTQLKQVIINAWQGLKLEAYPIELAQNIENAPWIRERGIKVLGFSVSFRVLSNKLKIDLDTDLEGDAPFLVAGLTSTHLNVNANLEAQLSKVEIYSLNGSLVVSGNNIGNTTKNQNTSFPISGASFAFAYYIIKIVFETSDTFYVRAYKSLPGYGNTHPIDILN